MSISNEAIQYFKLFGGDLYREERAILFFLSSDLNKMLPNKVGMDESVPALAGILRGHTSNLISLLGGGRTKLSKQYLKSIREPAVHNRISVLDTAVDTLSYNHALLSGLSNALENEGILSKQQSNVRWWHPLDHVARKLAPSQYAQIQPAGIFDVAQKQIREYENKLYLTYEGNAMININAPSPETRQELIQATVAYACTHRTLQCLNHLAY